MDTELPNIYDFSDFRCFLEAYRIARKLVDPDFTHQYICTHLGLPHTRGFFNNIVKGRRALTDANIDRFIKLLDLADDDALYFRLLVKYNQSDNPMEMDIYQARLSALISRKTRPTDTHRNLYYWKWYNSAIRTILGIIEFDGDYAKLAQMVHPPIRQEEATESVHLMLELGLLEKTENNCIKPTKVIPGSKLQTVKTSMSRHTENRNEPADCFPIPVSSQDNYTVFTNIIGVSDACYDKLLYKVNQFKTEVSTLLQQDSQSPTRMYYLNIFLFPESIK